MAETLTGSKDVMRFEHREEDVTCCIETLFCGSAKLIMGEEEVELKKSCCAGIINSAKRGRKSSLLQIGDTISLRRNTLMIHCTYLSPLRTD